MDVNKKKEDEERKREQPSANITPHPDSQCSDGMSLQIYSSYSLPQIIGHAPMAAIAVSEKQRLTEKGITSPLSRKGSTKWRCIMVLLSVTFLYWSTVT